MDWELDSERDIMFGQYDFDIVQLGIDCRMIDPFGFDIVRLGIDCRMIDPFDFDIVPRRTSRN